MDSVKPCATPMSPSTKTDKDDYVITFDEKMYRDMICNLSQLTTNRFNLIFGGCLCVGH